MNVDAGDLDRRITIQRSVETKDAAGDVIPTWGDDFRRWARKRDSRGREFFGAAQMVRDADTVFAVRSDSDTRAIAPETYRIHYKGQTWLVVGIAASNDRHDLLEILCCSRPDLRGARARETPSA